MSTPSGKVTNRAGPVSVVVVCVDCPSPVPELLSLGTACITCSLSASLCSYVCRRERTRFFAYLIQAELGCPAAPRALWGVLKGQGSLLVGRLLWQNRQRLFLAVY